MKYSIPVLIFLWACTAETGHRNKDIPVTFDYDVWVRDSILPSHPNLIEFNYVSEVDSDYEPDGDISDLKFTHRRDTLIVSFYKWQWAGCEIFGNIRISSDTVQLLFSNACPPNQDVFVEEVALFLFTYKIRRSDSIERKKWVPVEESLKIRH